MTGALLIHPTHRRLLRLLELLALLLYAGLALAWVAPGC